MTPDEFKKKWGLDLFAPSQPSGAVPTPAVIPGGPQVIPGDVRQLFGGEAATLPMLGPPPPPGPGVSPFLTGADPAAQEAQAAFFEKFGFPMFPGVDQKLLPQQPEPPSGRQVPGARVSVTDPSGIPTPQVRPAEGQMPIPLTEFNVSSGALGSLDVPPPPTPWEQGTEAFRWLADQYSKVPGLDAGAIANLPSQAWQGMKGWDLFDQGTVYGAGPQQAWSSPMAVAESGLLSEGKEDAPFLRHLPTGSGEERWDQTREAAIEATPVGRWLDGRYGDVLDGDAFGQMVQDLTQMVEEQPFGYSLAAGFASPTNAIPIPFVDDAFRLAFRGTYLGMKLVPGVRRGLLWLSRNRNPSVTIGASSPTDMAGLVRDQAAPARDRTKPFFHFVHMSPNGNQVNISTVEYDAASEAVVRAHYEKLQADGQGRIAGPNENVNEALSYGGYRAAVEREVAEAAQPAPQAAAPEAAPVVEEVPVEAPPTGPTRTVSELMVDIQEDIAVREVGTAGAVKPPVSYVPDIRALDDTDLDFFYMRIAGDRADESSQYVADVFGSIVEGEFRRRNIPVPAADPNWRFPPGQTSFRGGTPAVLPQGPVARSNARASFSRMKAERSELDPGGYVQMTEEDYLPSSVMELLNDTRTRVDSGINKLRNLEAYDPELTDDVVDAVKRGRAALAEAGVPTQMGTDTVYQEGVGGLGFQSPAYVEHLINAMPDGNAKNFAQNVRQADIVVRVDYEKFVNRIHAFTRKHKGAPTRQALDEQAAGLRESIDVLELLARLGPDHPVAGRAGGFPFHGNRADRSRYADELHGALGAAAPAPEGLVREALGPVENWVPVGEPLIFDPATNLVNGSPLVPGDIVMRASMEGGDVAVDEARRFGSLFRVVRVTTNDPATHGELARAGTTWKDPKMRSGFVEYEWLAESTGVPRRTDDGVSAGIREDGTPSTGEIKTYAFTLNPLAKEDRSLAHMYQEVYRVSQRTDVPSAPAAPAPFDPTRRQRIRIAEEPAAPVTGAPPRALLDSKPGYRDIREVTFDDPLDKAFYIIAGREYLSKGDPIFLRWAMDTTGLDQDQVLREAARIREDMKQFYVEGSDEMSIPQLFDETRAGELAPEEAFGPVLGQSRVSDRSTKFQADAAAARKTGGGEAYMARMSLIRQESHNRLYDVEDTLGRPLTRPELDELEESIVLDVGDNLAVWQKRPHPWMLDEEQTSLYNPRKRFPYRDLEEAVPAAAPVEAAPEAFPVSDELITRITRNLQESYGDAVTEEHIRSQIALIISGEGKPGIMGLQAQSMLKQAGIDLGDFSPPGSMAAAPPAYEEAIYGRWVRGQSFIKNDWALIVDDSDIDTVVVLLREGVQKTVSRSDIEDTMDEALPGLIRAGREGAPHGAVAEMFSSMKPDYLRQRALRESMQGMRFSKQKIELPGAENPVDAQVYKGLAIVRRSDMPAPTQRMGPSITGVEVIHVNSGKTIERLASQDRARVFVKALTDLVDWDVPEDVLLSGPLFSQGIIGKVTKRLKDDPWQSIDDLLPRGVALDSPLDDFAERHLQDWLNRTVPEDQHYAVASGIKRAIREEPSLIDRGWAEVRAFAERKDYIPRYVPESVAARSAEINPPKMLLDSKPRFKEGGGPNLLPQFSSPLDKALYIVAKRGELSKKDEDFLQWAMEVTGMSREDVIAEGGRVRQNMRQYYEVGKGDGEDMYVPEIFNLDETIKAKRQMEELSELHGADYPLGPGQEGGGGGPGLTPEQRAAGEAEIEGLGEPAVRDMAPSQVEADPGAPPPPPVDPAVRQVLTSSGDQGFLYIAIPRDLMLDEVLNPDNRVVQWLLEHTALKNVVGVANPSAMAKNEPAKLLIAYRAAQVEDDELIRVVLSAAYDSHARRFTGKMDLPIDRETGQWTHNSHLWDTAKDGPLPLWYDVWSNYKTEKYSRLLTERHKHIIADYLYVIDDEVERIREAWGLKPRRKKREAGTFFVPRKVRAWYDEKTESWQEFKRSSNPNLARMSDMATEMWQEHGIRYETDPRSVLELHLRQALHEIRLQQFSDWTEQLGLSVSINQLMDPQLVAARAGAYGEWLRAKQALRRARAAKNGEELQSRAGKLIADHHIDLDVAGQTSPAQAAMRAERAPIRAAQDAEIARLEGEIDRLWIKFAEIRGKYKLRRDQLRQTEKVKLSGDGVHLFGGHLTPDAKGEITVRVRPNIFRNKFFLVDDAKMIDDALGALDPEVQATGFKEKVGTTFNTVGNTSRFLASFGDFALPFYQLLPLLFRNPAAWLRATGNHYLAFIDPTVQARLIRQNLQDYYDLATNGVPVGDPEFFAALVPGQGINIDSLISKWGRKAAPGPGEAPQNALEYRIYEMVRNAQAAGRTTGRQTAGRFQSSYQVGLGYARVQLLRGIRKGWRGTDAEMYAYIRNMTGGLDSRRLGVGPTQRGIESTWMAFSPRLLRSTLALSSDALRGAFNIGLGDIAGVAGRSTAQQRESLRTIAQFIGGVFGIYVASGFAMGKDWEEIQEGINPANGRRFLAYEIGGEWRGVGGQIRALMQLSWTMGGLVSGQSGEFKDIISMNMMKNPLVMFYMSRGAPGIMLGGGILEALPGEMDVLPFDDIDGPTDFLGHVGMSSLPFALQSYIESRSLAGAFWEFFGGRSTYNPRDKMTNYITNGEETVYSEQLPMTRWLVNEMTPTGKDDWAGIEMNRRKDLINLGYQGDISYFDWVKIEDRYSGQRGYLAAATDFPEPKLDDPDPTVRGIAQFNSLFRDPAVRTSDGRSTPRSDENFRTLFAALKYAPAGQEVFKGRFGWGWTPEIEREVMANTNLRPIPWFIIENVGGARRDSIVASQNAREQIHIENGRPDLAALSRSLFYMYRPGDPRYANLFADLVEEGPHGFGPHKLDEIYQWNYSPERQAELQESLLR